MAYSYIKDGEKTMKSFVVRRNRLYEHTAPYFPSKNKTHMNRINMFTFNSIDRMRTNIYRQETTTKWCHASGSIGVGVYARARMCVLSGKRVHESHVRHWHRPNEPYVSTGDVRILFFLLRHAASRLSIRRYDIREFTRKT